MKHYVCICILLGVSLPGCQKDAVKTSLAVNEGNDKTTAGGTNLRNEDESRYSFGAVISGEEGLVHAFKFTNRSSRSIGVLGSINGKTCCGEVDGITPQTLQPGESTDLIVRIKPSTPGPLDHWAIVKTDEEGTEHRFWTFAEVHERIKVTPVEPIESSYAMNRKFTQVYDVALAARDKDVAEAKRVLSTARFDSDKSDSEIKSENGVRERSIGSGISIILRKIKITLDSGRSEERQISAVKVVDPAGNTMASFDIQWDVTPKFKISPSSIIAKQKSNASYLMIKSTDGEKFLVKNAKADLDDFSYQISGREGDMRESAEVMFKFSPNVGNTTTKKTISIEIQGKETSVLEVPVFFLGTTKGFEQ